MQLRNWFVFITFFLELSTSLLITKSLFTCNSKAVGVKAVGVMEARMGRALRVSLSF